MSKVVYDGCLEGDFVGFDDEQVFRMDDGSCWIQDRYRYWYHYAYRPKAQIMRDGSRYFLKVADESVEVRRADIVVESHIDGKFEGWKGRSQYRLLNGQVWEQAVYHYEYVYMYRPEAIIVDDGGTLLMYVEGTQVSVRRVK